MAKTTLRSGQVRNIDLQIEDLKDFGVVEASGLNVTVKAGSIRNDNTVTTTADQNLLLVDDNTNFIEIDSSGVATSNITGFTTERIPIAEVLTASGAISSITDKRAWIHTGIDPQTAINTTNITTNSTSITTNATNIALKADSTRVDNNQQNIVLNTFRIQIQNSLTLQNMIDGIADEYEDETGINTGSSSNQSYDSVNDLYSPTTLALNANVKLLLHMNGNDASTSFPDSSNVPHTVTAVANAQVDTAESKFGGASLLLDGTGDWLSIPNSDDWQITGSGGSVFIDGPGGGDDYLTIPDSADFAFGSGDFTVEAWIRFNTLPTEGVEQVFMSQGDFGTPAQESFSFAMFRTSGNLNIRFLFSQDGTTLTDAKRLADTTIINVWYHFAVSRDGNNLRFFQDGVQQGTTFDMTGVTLHNSTEPLLIGIIRSGANLLGDFDGFEDEIRISNSARFTANFTPQTSEYSNDGNTKLLLHFTSSFIDSSTTAHTVTPVGTAAIDNDKFVAFDADFTIDCWVRQPASVGVDEAIVSQRFDINNKWLFNYHPGSFEFTMVTGGVAAGLTFTLSGFLANVFQHVAITRSGHNWRVFLDGVQQGATVVRAFGIPNFVAPLLIGAINRPGFSKELSGHIDEFRLIKGEALWTANFTPPTGEAPSNADMTLLSNAQTANAQPDTARVVILEEDVDSITLNTDLKCFASRDGGTTFTQITLVEEGNFDVNIRVLAASVDISGQPAGTSMVYKFETANGKDLKLHATGLLWD